MLSQSPAWVGNSRRYNAYPLRSRKNVHYPPQPTYVRPPRRGPVPGPIRNPINSYRTCTQPISSTRTNILKKTTICQNNLKPNYNSPKIPRFGSNRKSLSMVDLSPVSIKPDVADLRSESTASLQTCLRKVELFNGSDSGAISSDLAIPLGNGVDSVCGRGSGIMEFPPDKNKASSIVCRALVINAWRRRREDNSQLQDTIQHLTQQVDHLRIQIVVLRRLLDTENGRVGRFVAEMQRVRVQFEDVTRDRDELKVEKENAIEETKQLREEAEEKSVATENLRNELFTVKTQLVALDGQISRDREKLLKLRDDKNMLLEKIASKDSLSTTYLTRAEGAEAEVEDLRSRLSSQKTLLSAAEEQEFNTVKEVKTKNEELIKLQKQLQLSQDVGNSMRLRANDLETKLADRDAALRRIESAYNLQLSEMSELRDRLSRQSQEGGWSSRVLQIAGSVVRAPRAIFRTLSFLSNPGSSVTS